MNIIFGMGILLCVGCFAGMTGKEDGKWKEKGWHWIQRYARKKGWQIPEWLTAACIYQTELAMVLSGCLLFSAGILEVLDRKEEILQLERPAYGQGIQEEEMEVLWEDETGTQKKEVLTVRVDEETLSEEEVESIFMQAAEKIEEQMLGENVSLDEVKKPLYLMESLEGWPLMVQWESSNPEVVNWDGTLGEKIHEEGESVELTAYLKLQGREERRIWKAWVFPEEKDGKQQIEDLVAKENEEQQSKELQLPTVLDGKKLRWRKTVQSSSYGLTLLAIVFPVFVIVRRQQQEKEQKKKQRQQMLQDYPEIVIKLQLLLSTGMNLRKSMERIAKDYVTYLRGEEVRNAYEIILETCWEMEHGLGEREAYEKMGERWDLLNYRTLSALLVQCLQKGTKDMEPLLAKEAQKAQRLRWQQAQILGEQASTKLLFPMILMLIVVFIILIIPAWMTFSV